MLVYLNLLFFIGHTKEASVRVTKFGEMLPHAIVGYLRSMGVGSMGVRLFKKDSLPHAGTLSCRTERCTTVVPRTGLL